MSIAQRAASGAAFTVATGLGTRVLGVVATVVLTRYVSPNDFGEVGDATIFAVTAAQVSMLGLGVFVTATPGAGRPAVFHATVYTLLSGIIACGGVALLRDDIGPLLRAPTMSRYVPGLALAMMIERLAFVPTQILARDLRFRALGLIRVSGDVVYIGGAIALAIRGWGAMAIVGANLARYTVMTTLVLAAVERAEWLTVSRLRLDTTRRIFRFALPAWVAGITGFGARKWDNWMVSRLFGPSVMAMYGMAYNFADIPATQVGEQIGDVLLPSLARVDPAHRSAALVRSTALLGLIIFPMAVGLGVVAPTLVAALLDPRWAAVAPMLTVLSVLSVARPIGWAVTSYLNAGGRPRFVMALEAAKLIVLLVAIALLGRFGPLWACTGVGIAYGLHALGSLLIVRRDGVPIRYFVTALGGPLAACVPMALAVIATRHGMSLLGIARDPRLGLLAESTVGAIVYIGAALVLARAVAHDFLSLAKRVLGRRED